MPITCIINLIKKTNAFPQQCLKTSFLSSYRPPLRPLGVLSPPPAWGEVLGLGPKGPPESDPDPEPVKKIQIRIQLLLPDLQYSL
jgi:hypothetical protein